MRAKRSQAEPSGATTTRIDMEARGSRLSIVGPALAVIALVAVLGVIWLSGKLVDLSGKAIDHADTSRSIIVPHGAAPN